MKKYISVKEAAEKWGISQRRVTGFCQEGAILGAKKPGKSWQIPSDAQKPADRRFKGGSFAKSDPLLPLPIGVTDYKEASTRYYYVDKTMMIRDFLDELPKVSLFTRPRRFGKTLNMDMLRVFFEKTDTDTSVYFKDRQIWSCGEGYRKEQGKYPVIFLSFKDVKFNTWDETLAKISELLSSEYLRHSEIAASDACNAVDRAFYDRIARRESDATEMTGALLALTRMLHAHHKIAPVLIIDEYDTPIQQGHSKNFYDQVIQFMRNLFSGGLKDNPHLSYGFLTGILRVAKESIFSGLNNLAVNSIMDEKYSEYFGFVPSEVRAMAAYYGVPEKYDEICSWYDGYRFGSADIFNPWSVINYFRNNCRAAAYWQSTGSNDIIGEVIAEADQTIYARLTSLLQGGSFLTYIDTGVIYPHVKNNPGSVYSFLLMAGYLKPLTADHSVSEDYICEVALPNKEISFVYKKEILNKLNGVLSPAPSAAIQEAIYTGDAVRLQHALQRFLTESVSFWDTAGEAFYHGLILGLCAMLEQKFYLTSNRESGEGRYDIQLMPKSDPFPGILIELKSKKGADRATLKKLAEQALLQINKCGYDAEMSSHGIHSVLKYGVAFSGKTVEVAVETTMKDGSCK